MGNVFFFDWEVRLIEALQSVTGSILSAIAVFFTMLGEEYLIIVVLGVVVFALVSAVFKIPEKAISAEMPALIFRLVRYAVSTFAIIGLYPHLFKKIKI